MQIFFHPKRSSWDRILRRPHIGRPDLEAVALNILKDVKNRGDEAVKQYSLEFDNVALTELKASEKEISRAEKLLSRELKSAIQTAKNNIECFHAAQQMKVEIVETMPGVHCWRKSVPIEKVGLYIPGGTAPLFSTVLMLGVPARLAGCPEIILCTPPRNDGSIHPAVLYSASLLGINSIFKAGGVQAIGAMAYGTKSIPAVYKIFGPGNQYVTAAKQLVNRAGFAIDLPAGPSEVLVLADHTAVPAYLAADLLSQAEHGVDSQVVLLVFDQKLVEEVQLEMEKQLKTLPRKAIAEKALENSPAIVLDNRTQALELINTYAPEHLILAITQAEEFAEKVMNAGSVFLGNYSPESVGDYASGTNHTLPTNGFARTYSGVSLDSFVKKITFQRLTKEGLQQLGPVVECMAQAEELTAHKNAVSIRLDT